MVEDDVLAEITRFLAIVSHTLVTQADTYLLYAFSHTRNSQPTRFLQIVIIV